MTSVALSPRVVLLPAGAVHPVLPEGTLILPTVPTQAFGDGSHPTTRLIAGALDHLCRQRKPGSVLDVGTGTGVLARIARARGACLVVATDIDPVALESARMNAALDRHPVEILISDKAPDAWGARFEVVAANILEGALRELAPALGGSVVPGGKLLMSGFTPAQSASLRVVYAAHGFSEFVEAHLDEWALLMAERRT